MTGDAAVGIVPHSRERTGWSGSATESSRVVGSTAAAAGAGLVLAAEDAASGVSAPVAPPADARPRVEAGG